MSIHRSMNTSYWVQNIDVMIEGVYVGRLQFGNWLSFYLQTCPFHLSVCCLRILYKLGKPVFGGLSCCLSGASDLENEPQLPPHNCAEVVGCP